MAKTMPKRECPKAGRHYHPDVSAGYRGGGKGHPVLVECTPFSRWLSDRLFPWWDRSVMERLPDWASGLLIMFWLPIIALIILAVTYFVFGVDLFSEASD